MSSVAILVAEDEPLILLDLASALEDAGFEVVGVSTAAAAITVFDEDPAKFRALLSDVRLGPGLSGWDVARHVRQTNSNIAVVYVSGDSSGQWSAEGVPKSIMIDKPFVMAQVITALSTLLNEAPSATDTQM